MTQVATSDLGALEWDALERIDAALPSDDATLEAAGPGHPSGPPVTVSFGAFRCH